MRPKPYAPTDPLIMQIYVAHNEKKDGPFTMFQIEEKLRAGELDEHSLAWHEGLSEWRPLPELEPFEYFFRHRDDELEDQRRRQAAEKAAAYERKSAETVPKSAVRPWTRFWARHLDFFFFLTACLLIFTLLRNLGWVTTTIAGFVDIFPMFLLFWHFLEAYLISRWGTTPGKYLTGIHILNAEGNRLDLGASLRRSLGVYVLGVGLYIGGLSLIAYMFGYYFLLKNRRTFWDSTAESYVNHAPFQARHVLLPLAIIFLLLTVFQGPFGEIAEYQSEVMEKMRKAISGEPSKTL